MKRKPAPALPPKWWSLYLQIKDAPPEGEAYMDEECLKIATLKDDLPPGVEIHLVRIAEAPREFTPR